MRRIDEKDEVDCSDKTQHTEMILERSTMDIMCRLKVGPKQTNNGWTEVFGTGSTDTAQFMCQTTFKGLHMDYKSQSIDIMNQDEVDNDDKAEKIHASLKMMNMGSYFYIYDSYVGT
jgi:hypothetical protein